MFRGDVVRGMGGCCGGVGVEGRVVTEKGSV